MPTHPVSPFLRDLLHARSPSGYETEAQEVFDRYVKPSANQYAHDALGNRIATLNPAGDPVLMLAGHIDELGLIITYINSEGFLYFDLIGGQDRTVISGRRVIIQTAHGPVAGVTGKRAIHLMDNAEYRTLPARLRMNIIRDPGVEKADFELFELAVSAINGCGACMGAHEGALKGHHGLSNVAIQAALRIAAVVNAVSRVVAAEAALAG